MAIGDSLTDEYESVSQLELAGLIEPGSIYPAPDFPNPDGNPTAENWPEILTRERGTQLTFGQEDRWPLDTRIRGFEYNFALVGTKTTDWLNILNRDVFGYDWVLWNFYLATESALTDTIADVDVVVIFIGGNDLEDYYGGLKNGYPVEHLLTDIPNRIHTIFEEIRARAPLKPVVVATVPDVGAAPVIFDDFTDPTEVATARDKITAMNEGIASHFGGMTRTTVARVDRVTAPLLEILLGERTGPYDLNGSEFVLGGDPYNPPNFLFCKDRFHPNTVGQALIANEIVAAINQHFPQAVDPLTHREILSEVLFLDPDQPFLDWAMAQDLSPAEPQADPDGDGLPNLVEMILDSSPVQASTGVEATPDGLRWLPQDQRYATLVAEESDDLVDWSTVPASRRTVVDGVQQATRDPEQNPSFLRLRATPRP
jgi:lysophospholipase L1-like esterase